VRVAIVGAGLAGLAAARALHAGGHDVRVFERAAGVGGRCSTRILEGFPIDTGATSIAPRGRSLEQAMLRELNTDGLHRVLLPIYTHTGLRVSPGDASRAKIDRYAYEQGNQRLPELLAEGLDVCFESNIEGIAMRDDDFVVANDVFDAVILTQPAVEAHAMLQQLGVSRPLGLCKYRRCLAVSLVYKEELEPLHYHALIDPEQRHPLTWLSLESQKVPNRNKGGTALMAQLGPQFSDDYFEADEGGIIGATVEYVEKLYSAALSTPIAFDLMRWTYSQPENVAMFDSVNRPGSRLLVAGDGLLGGRTEYAFETGMRAARQLMELP
jgi:predicted NAD/FAD-dependent oxidoreductase